MGGKRIADQVRRALMLAAKVAPVVAAIDASGCDIEPENEYPCAAVCPRDYPCPPDAWGYGGGGYSPSKKIAGSSGGAGANTGGRSFGGAFGMGGRDAGGDSASKSDASTDASKDGG